MNTTLRSNLPLSAAAPSIASPIKKVDDDRTDLIAALDERLRTDPHGLTLGVADIRLLLEEITRLRTQSDLRAQQTRYWRDRALKGRP